MDQFLFIFGPGSGPDFIHFLVRVLSLPMASPGLSPDLFLVRLRILSIFESGSGFYPPIRARVLVSASVRS